MNYHENDRSFPTRGADPQQGESIMSKRAERRKHKRRKKMQARRVFHWMRPELAEHLGDHLAQCSCAACGNPRKWFKEKTHSEKKSDLDFKEQL